MKLKIVEIEATADDLKASNSLADALNSQLRKLFCPPSRVYYADDDEEEDEE